MKKLKNVEKILKILKILKIACNCSACNACNCMHAIACNCMQLYAIANNWPCLGLELQAEPKFDCKHALARALNSIVFVICTVDISIAYNCKQRINRLYAIGFCENLRKSAKICENLRNSAKNHEILKKCAKTMKISQKNMKS